MSVKVQEPIVILDPSLIYRPDFKPEDKYRNFNKDEVCSPSLFSLIIV